MVIPGKPNLEICLLTDNGLDEFLSKCAELGLENNKDRSAIKLDKMTMPYGQYFVGWDNETNSMWNLAGVHHLPELGPNVWRVLFRGAQLPGYALGVGKDFLKISYHWRYFLPLQIAFIQERYPDAEFVVTTNVKNSTAGKSDRLDKKVMPPLLHRGIVSLLKEDYELFNTKQNVWLIDVNKLTQALAQY
jgi:hypothetical protein